MDGSGITEQFLQGSLERRFELITDPGNSAALRAYLGNSAFEGHAALAEVFLTKRAQPHLSAGSRSKVIFIPGVMGSLLCSQGMGGVWWIDAPRLLKRLNDLRLATDGEHDVDARFRIEACSVDHIYAEFLAKLADEEDFDYTVFTYDWRKPVLTAAGRLRELVLHEFEASGNHPVGVIAHSMGGLVVSAALMNYGDELWPKVSRIALIGTPHYGSPAIAGYLKQHFWGLELLFLLGRFLSRPAFRSMRGVLNLLPAPAGIYPGSEAEGGGKHPCADFDLYDVDAWELTLGTAERQSLAESLLCTRRLHENLHRWRRGWAFEHWSRIAMIAGVGYKTLFRLETKASFGFGVKRITDRAAKDIHREGDGRVPLASATLDRADMRYVRGRHDELPMIPAVYTDAFRWLRGNEMTLPTTPEGVFESHLAGGEGQPSRPDLLPPRSIEAGPDSPGYLDEGEPDPARLDELERQLVSGSLPEFIRLRIL